MLGRMMNFSIVNAVRCLSKNSPEDGNLESGLFYYFT